MRLAPISPTGRGLEDPSNVQWQMDVVYSLDDLAKAGDDPRGRWGEALAILARLKSQGTLAPSQQGWIERVNGALAASAADGPTTMAPR